MRASTRKRSTLSRTFGAAGPWPRPECGFLPRAGPAGSVGLVIETLTLGRRSKKPSRRAWLVAAFLMLAAVSLFASAGVVHLLGYSPQVNLMGGSADGGVLYPVSCSDCVRGVSSSVRVLLVWTLTLVVAAAAAVIVRLGRFQR